MLLLLTLAQAADVLVYGPIDYTESTHLTTAGHTVTSYTATQWAAAAQSDFESFDVIVFGDKNCSGPNSSDWTTPYNNRTTWSPAVTGNILVTGNDAGCHASNSSARNFLVHAVEWAASGGGTGLYVSSDWGRRDFDFLDQFGTWGSTTSHGDSVSITDASHDHWTGTYGTVTNINSWGNTHHAYIDTYPSDFDVTATRSSGGAVVVVRESCDVDEDGYDSTLGSCGGSDCDDGDDTVYPSATELCDGQDNDCDGSLDATENDDDNDGFVECTLDSGGWDGTAVTGYEDCDDGDDTVYPGATELCDGQDNDCDGSLATDESDVDGDDYVECAVDSGGWDGTAVTGYEDCDDSDDTVYPTASELCDGQDNDCDGSLDTTENDDDGDGYVECAVDGDGWDGTSVTGFEDCDDDDDSVYPTASELCDGQDNDCDSAVPTDETDDDQDGYVECVVDSDGWDGSAAVTGFEDCDDTDDTVYPTASELCDGQDNDCDGSLDVTEADADGDYWVECVVDTGGWDGAAVSGFEDCDDADATVHPTATELCDGLDNDCDTLLPAVETDDDLDGWVECTEDGDGWDGTAITGHEDCDDTDPDSWPGAPEIEYDGIDQDCSGADLCDVDGDGYDYDGEFCYGDDCDDLDAEVNVDADERWYDGIDQDCDQGSDYDADGDGFDSASYGGEDCDDADENTYPGAPDTPGDGIVTDCNGADEYDADGDGFDGAEYGGDDCDDANSEINPGVDETWYDGVDSDCDEQSDFDQDGDGADSAEYGGEDCDDLDDAVILCPQDTGDTGIEGVQYKGGGGCGMSSTVPVPVSGLLALFGLALFWRRR